MLNNVYQQIAMWLGHIDRTEAMLLMTIGVIAGSYFLRGLSSKWN